MKKIVYVTLSIFAALFVVLNVHASSPPAAGPVCNVAGEIVSVEYQAAWEAPPEMYIYPRYMPERYLIQVAVDSTTYVSGPAEGPLGGISGTSITCIEKHPVGSEVYLTLMYTDIPENSIPKVGGNITANIEFNLRSVIELDHIDTKPGQLKKETMNNKSGEFTMSELMTIAALVVLLAVLIFALLKYHRRHV